MKPTNWWGFDLWHVFDAIHVVEPGNERAVCGVRVTRGFPATATGAKPSCFECIEKAKKL